MQTQVSLLHSGIYTVGEAARFSGVSAARIRRWLRGYAFRTARGQRRSEPVWHGELAPLSGTYALSFPDLIELRFIEAFLKAGVTWWTLRLAHKRGVELFGKSHPFSTNQFVTDGRQVFVQLETGSGSRQLLDIIAKQQVFADRMQPLLEELEFGPDNRLLRWRPRAGQGSVVLDPERNFGLPILEQSGIPTSALARATKLCPALPAVARWYEISTKELEHALEYEQYLLK